MKKIFTLMVVLAMGAGMIHAQVVDTNAQQQYQQSLQQQQEFLQMQQEQQEQALKENQKEQERLQKEQAKVEKEQAKAAKAAEKEQAIAEKEALRAEKEAKAEAKRQRREEIGRGPRLGADPYVFLSMATRNAQYADLYNTRSILGLGLDVTYHYPLNKKVDFVAGIGYRFSSYHYRNMVDPNNDQTDLVFTTSGITHLERISSLTTSTIMIPIHLNFVGKKGNEVYLGVDAGYAIKAQFGAAQLDESNNYNEVIGKTDMKNFKNMRLDFVVGFTRDNWLIFAPGVECYFNILPTYIDGTNNNNPVHEFGIKIQL